MSHLLQPLKLGELDLPNRLIMAPLTRCRATPEARVPTPLMAEYYAQRATAGLIISEATAVDPMGVGYPNTPGIWSEEQVAGWRQVTEAVHAKEGRIFLQLWHVGRISHPFYLNGALPVAPSAIAAEGHVSLMRPKTPFAIPRSLDEKEIPGIIAAFRQGAENAMRAGFDGVEIHGANGYLLDQFLQDSANHRQDGYGGTIESRARLYLEVADAVISVWGAGRVGAHIAPRGDAYSMGDSDKLATFTYLAEQLGKRQIAFVCAREHVNTDSIGPKLKEVFGGIYIANEGFTLESGAQVVQDGLADAVAYGALFIANPDLVERHKAKAPLNAPNPQTYYGPGPEGYTDYPFMMP